MTAQDLADRLEKTLCDCLAFVGQEIDARASAGLPNKAPYMRKPIALADDIRAALASLRRSAPASGDTRDAVKTWVLVRDPNCTTERKRPFSPNAIAFIRELINVRPNSHIDVLTVSDGEPDIEDGMQYLASRDGRSASKARAHINRLRTPSGETREEAGS